MIVGISGPSGSGKTSVCDFLLHRLPNTHLLQQDWYFKEPEEYREDANFCDLQYLLVEQFVEDVRKLRNLEAIIIPHMDTKTFRRTGALDVIESGGDFLLIEGMTIFRIPALLPLLDRKIYLSPGVAAIRERKWKRDQNERRRSAGSIQQQLLWVEEEYRKDLETLGNDVLLLDNSGTSLAQACDVICDFIMQG